MPFDIPNNWTWIRQSSLCWLENGEKTYDKKLPYLEAKVIRGLKEPDYVNSGIIVDQTNKVILVDGENSGEIMTPPFKGYLGSTFKIFAANASFNYDYLLLIFLLNKEMYRNSKVGAAIPHLNKELFRNSLIAVPPLEEQQRIVDRINMLKPLLQEYDSFEKKLTKLEEEFPEKLKKSILQYAIEGKLVKQDPNDEPASVLLERIKAEKESLIKAGKIKRDKNESYIYQGDDKNYYENLPQKWSLCAIKDISIITMGQSPDGSTYGNTGMEFHQGKSFFTEKLLGHSNIKTTAPTKIAPDNSIIMSIRAPVGDVNYCDRTICIGRGLCAFKEIINGMNEYLYLVLEGSKKYFVDNSTGTTFKAVSSDTISKLIVMLPPFREQQKIVKKFNRINDFLRI